MNGKWNQKNPQKVCLYVGKYDKIENTYEFVMLYGFKKRNV